MDAVLCSHYVQREAGRSQGFVIPLFMKFLFYVFFFVFFTRNDALGTVCSLLRPACNSGFDRDEENANLV